MAYGVDVVRPAVVAIDLHRGHMDPTVATMPVIAGTEQRILEANRRFFAGCRAAGIPIIHLLTTYRDVTEIRANPFWRALSMDAAATRRNAERHNLAGSPGCEIMPQVYEPGDFVVNTKKRYNCFQDTDLLFLLRSHQVNTLLLTGVNTNSCVLATATAACCLDFSVVVIEECVDSMDGREAHEHALHCIRLAFGWVATGAEALATCGAAHATAVS